MKLVMNRHMASRGFGSGRLDRGTVGHFMGSGGGLRITLCPRLALLALRSVESIGLGQLDILNQPYQL